MRLPRVARRLSLSSVLLMGALAACSKAPEPAAQVHPVVVEHAQALTSDAGEIFPGAVHAREEADLSFRIAGKIHARNVDAGAEVKAGQVLATLDPQDNKLNTDASRAAVNAAQADVKLAQADLKRYQELLDKGFVSKSMIEQKQNTLDLAVARLDQAKSNYSVVDNQMGYTTLRATKSGLITAVLAESGQVVAAGQPVFRFAADNTREVVISVPEGRVDALRSAARLGVSLWANPGKMYEGKVRSINLQADPSTRTHEARISIIGSDDAVQLGMTATVYMGARIDASLFQVPLSALAQVDNKPVVWTVGSDGKVHKIAVTVQRYVENFAVVSGALNPGMPLVSAGVQLLVEGQPVKAVERHREGRAP
ncbi:MAG: efflux RND transporter periplasmic adaptor subunit [Cupriavidus sp.]|nr:MAG: efflux RND transporter periplasmic adaptor subunit [Cupriavidus sp.]